MRRVRDVEAEVLTRPGRYRPVADNLQVKEVWGGDGERRKRYVLCLNPQEAERQGGHDIAAGFAVIRDTALLARRRCFGADVGRADGIEQSETRDDNDPAASFSESQPAS